MVVVAGLLLLLLVPAAASVCAVTWLYSYSWLPSQAVKWTRNWIVKRGKRGQMSFFCFILKLLFPHMELPGYTYVKTVVCGILRCGFKSIPQQGEDKM